MCYVQAKVMAYDCLDMVVVTARVWCLDHPTGECGAALEVTCQTRGEGVTEASRWLCDALVSLAETL